ncbi:hypothetical protein KIPB_005163 [Kipferlia bialata]|uniref:TM2 domain-containing protein n=1 Tax=Kipferlia bialata TaxID=797122 RepID=A0A9K3CV64_9EUKA|nr:hypothetical protein KIPB_005163 [Kipferlia bialata]|eukprot:g5163.t1
MSPTDSTPPASPRQAHREREAETGTSTFAPPAPPSDRLSFSPSVPSVPPSVPSDEFEVVIGDGCVEILPAEATLAPMEEEEEGEKETYRSSELTGAFSLSNEEYVDNMTKGWCIYPSTTPMHYAMVAKTVHVGQLDYLRTYKAHCTESTVSDLVLVGESYGTIENGLSDHRGDDFYNCAYVEFVSDGYDNDYAGVTVEYCVNAECLAWWKRWLGKYLGESERATIRFYHVESVLVTGLVSIGVYLGRGLMGSESLEAGVADNRRDGMPEDYTSLDKHPSDRAAGHEGDIEATGASCDDDQQSCRHSPFVRTEPPKSGWVLACLYLIGLHRWYLGMPHPWLFLITLGGLGYWWAIDIGLVFVRIEEVNSATSGWSKRMAGLKRKRTSANQLGAADVTETVTLAGPSTRVEVVAAEILSRPRGMGHSGEARPVFVYTGPLFADGLSPADSLGEGEAYTALLIGANRVNQNNNCWLLTFDSTSDLVVTQSIPCPLSPTLSHFTATRIAGEVYVFGGRDSSTKQCTNMLTVYTIESGEWLQVEMSGDGPSPRYGHTAFTLEGCLYVGMGLPSRVKPHLSPYDSKSTSKERVGGHEDFWCYDTQSERWTQIDDPPYTGCFVASVTAGETAHLFGGSSFHNCGWIDKGRSNFHLTYNETDGWGLLADTPFQSAMPGVFKVGSHIHVIRRVKDSPTEVHVYNTKTKEWRRGCDIPIVHGNISCGTITRYRVLLQNEDEMVEGELVAEREREVVEKEAERLAASLAALGMPAEDIEAAPLSDSLTPMLRDRIEVLEHEVSDIHSRIERVDTGLQKAEREVELLSNPDTHMPEALRLLAEYRSSVSLETKIRSLSFECHHCERMLRRTMLDQVSRDRMVAEWEGKKEQLLSLKQRGEGIAALRAELDSYRVFPTVASALTETQ